MTAANQLTIVEIEFLAAVGWKRGRRPFSCPCSLNVTPCRKELCWTCLSKESMPFVNSKPPIPTRSLRFLRAAVRSTSSAVNYDCIMPIPSLTPSLQKKAPFFCAEEQKVFSRSCGLQDLGVSKNRGISKWMVYKGKAYWN